eukprot:CAMPEP_0168718318 /NCGR_PEP_ID=MMETSP0724-20121128/454_1 /TAXON_ID=265536 /ORGANISM="Amphiprora sp., Strain CCMP467" /LENGTH=1038 /DNA_ID=CAMNT_0008764823 /DNA_START=22 /DNA_END=3138 /DNA_ORIENTATION=+
MMMKTSRPILTSSCNNAWDRARRVSAAAETVAAETRRKTIPQCHRWMSATAGHGKLQSPQHPGSSLYFSQGTLGSRQLAGVTTRSYRTRTVLLDLPLGCGSSSSSSGHFRDNNNSSDDSGGPAIATRILPRRLQQRCLYSTESDFEPSSRPTSQLSNILDQLKTRRNNNNNNAEDDDTTTTNAMLLLSHEDWNSAVTSLESMAAARPDYLTGEQQLAQLQEAWELMDILAEHAEAHPNVFREQQQQQRHNDEEINPYSNVFDFDDNKDNTDKLNTDIETTATTTPLYDVNEPLDFWASPSSSSETNIKTIKAATTSRLANEDDSDDDCCEPINCIALGKLLVRWRRCALNYNDSRAYNHDDSNNNNYHPPVPIPESLTLDATLTRLQRYMKTDGLLTNKSPVPYNIVLAALSDQPQRLQEMIQQLEQYHITAQTYMTVISAWRKAQQPQRCEDYVRTLAHRVERGELPRSVMDSHLFNNTIAAWTHPLVETGLQRSMDLLELMQAWNFHPDAATYNAIFFAIGNNQARTKRVQKDQKLPRQQAIDASSQVSAHDVDGLFQQMVRQWRAGLCRPDARTFNAVLMATTNTEEKTDNDDDDTMQQRIENLFDTMQEMGVTPDVKVGTSLMAAWSRLGQPDKAEDVYQEMMNTYQQGNMNFQPSHSTHVTRLMAWSRAGDAEMTARVLDDIIVLAGKNDLDRPPQTREFNAVLQAWTKTNIPEQQRLAATRCDQFLQDMKLLAAQGRFRCQPDVYSYTAVMTTHSRFFTKHYSARRCQEIFIEMRQHGIVADSKTYSILMDAWKQENNPEQMEDVFQYQVQHWMQGEAALKPSGKMWADRMAGWFNSSNINMAVRTFSHYLVFHGKNKVHPKELLPVLHVIAKMPPLVEQEILAKHNRYVAKEAEQLLRHTVRLHPNAKFYSGYLNAVLKAYANTMHPKGGENAYALFMDAQNTNIHLNLNSYLYVLNAMIESSDERAVPHIQGLLEALLGQPKQFWDHNADRYDNFAHEVSARLRASSFHAIDELLVQCDKVKSVALSQAA